MGESPEVFVADANALAEKCVTDFTTEGRRALACEFFWADERIVPSADPDSNYGVALSLFLGPAGISAERIHRIASLFPHDRTLYDRRPVAIVDGAPKDSSCDGGARESARADVDRSGSREWNSLNDR